MNDLNYIDAVGILAGICTTAAVVPQLLKAWKTKRVDDVSLPMFLVLVTGVTLWTVYGVLKSDLAIILANGVSVLLNASLLYLLLAYRSTAKTSRKRP